MDIDLRSIWLNNANGLVSPAFAKDHIIALQNQTKPVEPIVHYDYFNLMLGPSQEVETALEAVGNLLETLENAGRKIVVLTGSFERGTNFMERVFPDKPSWTTKETLKSGTEFYKRASARQADVAKAELLISRKTIDEADINHAAHVSVFNPNSFSK